MIAMMLQHAVMLAFLANAGAMILNNIPMVSVNRIPKGTRHLTIDIGPGENPFMKPRDDTLLVLVEPVLKTALALKKKFHGDQRVLVAHLDIANFTGNTTIFSGRATSKEKVDRTQASSDTQMEKVGASTLKEFMALLPLKYFNQTIDAMRIDAEGNLKIIESAGNSIKKVKRIEVSAYTKSDVTAYNKKTFQMFFKENGFKAAGCKKIKSRKPKTVLCIFVNKHMEPLFR